MDPTAKFSTGDCDDGDDDFFDEQENQPSTQANLPPAVQPPPALSSANVSLLCSNEIIGCLNSLGRQNAALFSLLTSLSGQVGIIAGHIAVLNEAKKPTHLLTPRPAYVLSKRTARDAGMLSYHASTHPLLRGGAASFSSSSASSSSAATAVGLAVAEEGAEKLEGLDDDGDETVAYSQSSSASYEPSPTQKSRTNSPWTAEETDVFLQGLQKFGPGKWKEILAWDAGEYGQKMLVNRTGVNLKDKAKQFK